MVPYRITSLEVNPYGRYPRKYTFAWCNQIEGRDDATRKAAFQMMDYVLCKTRVSVHEDVALRIYVHAHSESYELRRKKHARGFLYWVNNVKCLKREYCADLHSFGIHNGLNSAKDDWINIVQMPASLFDVEMLDMLDYNWANLMQELNDSLQLAYRHLKEDGAVDAWFERVDGNGIAVRLRDANGGEVDPMQETGSSLAISSMSVLHALNVCKGNRSLIVHDIDCLYDGNNAKEMMEKLGTLSDKKLQLVCTSSPQGVATTATMKVMNIQ
ncbi:hypothetical protein CAEBREN_12410 [Caenorhabditis brenneri]|uniref:Uncharacterized protein n=1 Tax=Caenorhabditis brenneri TaxID=135651 RepID=G0MYA1_CAEBE|nr:hypothetical protein CAEBREN_12410 [Caenorhabditis brenneri]